MGKKNDLLGQTFNNLKTIKECGRDENYKVLWEFECLLCGNKHITNGIDVKRGKVKSCGCLKNVGTNNGNWKGYEGISGSLYQHYKYSASKRNLKFNIGIEYLWELYIKQDKKCIYTGIELLFKKEDVDFYDNGYYKRTALNASLDRIDSSKGYIKGNLQWVYKKINIMKNDLSDENFKKLCRLVSINS